MSQAREEVERGVSSWVSINHIESEEGSTPGSSDSIMGSLRREPGFLDGEKHQNGEEKRARKKRVL